MHSLKRSSSINSLCAGWLSPLIQGGVAEGRGGLEVNQMKKNLITILFVAVSAFCYAQPALVPPLGTITGITELTSDQPQDNSLEQNVPNPSVGQTSIAFSLKESGLATINVFDCTGKLVASLVNHQLNYGKRQVTFNTSSFPEGIYIYQLSLNNRLIGTKRLVILNQ